MTSSPSDQDIREIVKAASSDDSLRQLRASLAAYTGEVFGRVGMALEIAGHVIGPDRADKTSPFNHGSDEAVGVGVLLQISQRLVDGSRILFEAGNTYAGAALVRQLVEVEYLAWAFDTRNLDAQRWLRSDKKDRQAFFSPRKLREAAGGTFRAKDYGYHCELGGHPVPGATVLLNDQGQAAQLMLSDMLGHTGRVWDHLASWGATIPHGEIIRTNHAETLERYVVWKAADPLAHLPPPP